MEWPHFLDRQLTKSKPLLPSAEGPWGLGDWRRMPGVFRARTWQVPGSMGICGKRAWKQHHLWNCNFDWLLLPLPSRVSKAPQSAGERERVRHRDGAGGGRKEKKMWLWRSSVVQSPWSPLQLSSSRELAGRQGGEGKSLKILTYKETSTVVFSFCSPRTRKTPSKPLLCVVLKSYHEIANAFSAADQRSGFTSWRKFAAETLQMSLVMRWGLFICAEIHT